jgi:cell division protein ZapE
MHALEAGAAARSAPRPASARALRRAKAAGRLAARGRPGFRAAAARTGFAYDPGQQQARALLEERLPPHLHGWYLWGPVGRGKTHLAQLLFDTLPTDRRVRFHFHDFFRDLHAEITRTRQPVREAITRTLRSARAVMFDEFHVHDVADASFLTSTLRVLEENGTLLIATSNYAPEALLPNPLFHEHALPAIALLTRGLRIVEVPAGPDHREDLHRDLREERHAQPHSGLHGGEHAPPVPSFSSGSWRVIDPEEPAAASGSFPPDTFTFHELCERPVGPHQYLALAERLAAVRVVEVPDLARAGRDPLQRFATLVDVLHDRQVPLHVTSSAAPDRMLSAAEPPLDAARTVSRLRSLRRRGRMVSMTAPQHPASPDQPAPSPTPAPPLTAAQIVAHIRFVQPGIDKTSALMLLYFVSGWLEAWHEAPVVDSRFEAWEYGPTDPQAHAEFSSTFPQRLKRGDEDAEVMLTLEVDAVIRWGLGEAAGQRTAAPSSVLIGRARATSAYAETVARADEPPAFASGPEIPPGLLRDCFRELARAVPTGEADGPERPAAEALAEHRRQVQARSLRNQLAERFDTGPGLSPA